MTLHSSKGLEFPVVFLAGMEEGLFPSVKLWEETPVEDIEEERRLCYVGMTRARERLYCMHAVMRRLWGNTNFADPSRFFDEMPDNLIEFRDYSGRGASTARRLPVTPTKFGSNYGKRSSDDDFSQATYDDDVPTFDAHSGTRQKPASWGSGNEGTTRIFPFPGAGSSRASMQNDLIGRKLNHAEYGQGTIIAVDGSGTDQKVTVEFQNRQQRKFLFRYVASYLE
jgi:DNA helicase-2/ATP-dependent DNA helicase PcrA